jgi:hypothetical protein
VHVQLSIPGSVRSFTAVSLEDRGNVSIEEIWSVGWISLAEVRGDLSAHSLVATAVVVLRKHDRLGLSRVQESDHTIEDRQVEDVVADWLLKLNLDIHVQGLSNVINSVVKGKVASLVDVEWSSVVGGSAVIRKDGGASLETRCRRKVLSLKGMIWERLVKDSSA